MRARRRPSSRRSTSCESLRENSVLVGKGGLDGNVLRVKPPRCMAAADVDYALDAFDVALRAVSKD